MPARGKTYIGTKLARYLRWCGLNVRVFNVGEYRRQATTAYRWDTGTRGHVGSVPRGSNQECFRNHEFFRAENKEALALRTAVADAALNDTLKFLREEGEIAIFDATNTTRERRQKIFDQVKENGFKCLFLESVCDNPKLIESNILDVKLKGPDYKNMDREEALGDFLQRIDHYRLELPTNLRKIS